MYTNLCSGAPSYYLCFQAQPLGEQAIGHRIMGAEIIREGGCSDVALQVFETRTAGLDQEMLRVNVLTLVNAILAAILVGIGTYGTRYRHRDISRALFQGATTLFLPILSYVASSASSVSTTGASESSRCNTSVHLILSLIWAGLVQIVGINTFPTVAASDREGRNTGIPLGVLVQAIWVSYLFISLTPDASFDDFIPDTAYPLPAIMFGLIFAKLALRYYEFKKARRSFALGRNPPLIVGYAEQMQEESDDGIAPTVEHCPCPPPPLLVMGEETADVGKGPHGFHFKQLRPNTNNNPGLVTIDRVWQLDGIHLTPVPWLRLKDVCLSLALFKLLRCRFAGYTVAEAGFQQVYRFFLDVLLKDEDHERVHRVVTDELSFLHDYYYSTTAIHYSSLWLPILNIFASVLIICYCLALAGVGMIHFISDRLENGDEFQGQAYCTLECYGGGSYDVRNRSFGNLVFDVVPVGILLVIVMLSEAREIASHIFSNWTKVALICRYYVRQQSPQMKEWIGPVLRGQCKLMKHWDDKMNQCSVLVLEKTRAGQGQMLSVAIRHLLRLPNRNKNVRVPGEVKAAIVDALRGDNGLLTDPRTFLRQSLQQLVQDGGNSNSNSNSFLWACESKGICDLILMWHIATSILSVRLRREQHPRPSQDRVTAEHLSQYCAYLVAYVPELLPENDAWCKSLYKAIKEEAMMCALAGHGGWCMRAVFACGSSQDQSEYDKLVTPLQERAKHEVLMKGVKLGKQLVELQEGDASWRLLAGFWSRMILYVGPSDNLNGHAEAIARGGELITQVWALLMHAGISCRPATPGAPATYLGV